MSDKFFNGAVLATAFLLFLWFLLGCPIRLPRREGDE